jgi:AraC-like DNA-binding protein
MKLSKLFRIRKSRKYPIKRDGEGRSLRARCSELFEQDKRPVEVAGELKMEETTVYRYFRDWNRLGPNFERQYAYVRSLFSKTAPDRDKNIELFAKVCGISKEQFEVILSQPHGLRRLMTGKYHFPAHADVDHKLHKSLELAILISDHLVNDKGSFEDIYFALKHYMQEAKRYREEEDARITEDNKIMSFFHRVLAQDMENERQRRVKPDEFPKEEQDAITQFVIDSELRKTTITYWLRIGILMAKGLTKEEAREKMYRDLLEKGDIKGAKMLREFQDRVHPVNPDSKVPPKPPEQPPSSS